MTNAESSFPAWTRGIPALAATLTMAALCVLPLGASPKEEGVVRIGFQLIEDDQSIRARFEGALDRWQEEMNSLGQTPEVEAVVFDRNDNLEKALQTVRVEAAVIYSHSLLELLESVRLEIGCAVGKDRGGNFRFIVLGRKDGPIRSIEDLDGATLDAVGSRFSHLPLMWLEQSISNSGMVVGPRVSKAESAFDAIVRTYFGQSDAALVTREDFQANVKLNSLLALDLAILAESPPLPSRFLVFPIQTPTSIRRNLINRTLNAQLQIKDHPFLPILIEEFHEYKEEDSVALLEILRDHGKLVHENEAGSRNSVAGEPDAAGD
ncbi:MAG: PhnD/SsuA/transferrin family substrate-binding protein [Verrucomicrobiota bacterium]